MEGQKQLFEVIKSKISPQYRLADVIEDLLGVSADSAYRRISGKKELSFSELQKICEKFTLSMDEILNYKSRQGALFDYVPINFLDQNAYVDYLKRLSDGMTILKSAPDKDISFTAQDIPFYHFSKYPELTFFKLYAWNDSIIREPVSYHDFCRHLDKDRIMSVFEQIHNSYMAIPSKEIWTSQTIDTILRLLEHYFEIKSFANKETVFLLLDQLSELIDTIKKYADDGYKGKMETPFSMYVCSVDLENNFMLFRRGNDLLCRIKLYTINSITTVNEFLCLEISKWIDDLVSKSIQINCVSAKERFRFFQSSKNKIEILRNKVEIS